MNNAVAILAVAFTALAITIELLGRRLNFFGMLRQQHHYEVEAFPINFRGNRLRKTDRDPASSFEPKEKCVDIALATSMLFSAAMPNAYDVAVPRPRRQGLQARDEELPPHG